MRCAFLTENTATVVTVTTRVSLIHKDVIHMLRERSVAVPLLHSRSIFPVFLLLLLLLLLLLGYAVTLLVEALRYKPEGRGFDSR